MARVVLIEDDPAHARTLAQALREGGHEVTHHAAPAGFVRELGAQRPAALVLDWGLPGMDGGAVIRRVREVYGRALPIVVVTADRSEQVALHALALDADDFVHKPVSGPVLRARLAAVLRRREQGRDDTHLLQVAPYRLDRARQQLWRGEEPLRLTPREFDLAWLLFSNTSRLVSHAELMAGLWGVDETLDTHTLSQHVYSLRRKLDLAGHGFRLRSVYGAGYRLLPPGEGGADDGAG